MEGEQSEFWWVSFLAISIAMALKDPDPEKILKPALQRFMRSGTSSAIRAQLFAILKEGEKVDGRR